MPRSAWMEGPAVATIVWSSAASSSPSSAPDIVNTLCARVNVKGAAVVVAADGAMVSGRPPTREGHTGR
ncbi:hypothetical protein MFU01_83790 [Myxococcus fulvus]|uniref:Uncharacterized protein n=1 Tax=Myxococcus fulvus TaxID=33 RepID=A0A511TJ22_MYXFU|nr:hypothetical protein MFU01_83790 [Myxococcus fulvus]